MSTSKYTGVSWKKQDRKWISVFTYKGITYDCGSYDDELKAVKARDRRIISLGANYDKLQVIKPMKRETENP